LSEVLFDEGKDGVLASDDLMGSRTGLASGYGQSKWVSEQLLLEARRRNLPVTIIRPGYIVGDSITGITNTDDFIWRLVKGCVQLSLVPSMQNVINMCSVDYVAAAVVEVAMNPIGVEQAVYHISNPHTFRFSDLFSLLSKYGYDVHFVEYMTWRKTLMDVTLASNDNALYPLLHFVLDDLPTSTRSPELNTHNTDTLTKAAGIHCLDMGSLMQRYLTYLIKVAFLPPPQLPSTLDVTVDVHASLVTRTERS
jgi:L-aminoadipate-semialdehyde dehydrogenase